MITQAEQVYESLEVPAPATLEIDVTENGSVVDLESFHAEDIESTLAAWVCVLGSFLFMLPTFGMMQSVGTFQSYLQLNQLHQYSTSEVGWITGVYMFLGMLASIQVGPIIDQHGPRILSIIGAAGVATTFFIFAECKTYWQCMLCFGIFGGLSTAIAGTIGVTVVGKLFFQNRGLAIGLAMTGSSTGTVIFPIMLRSLLPKLGWAWSMRVVGFVIIGILTPGIFCFIPYPRLLASVTPPTQLPTKSTAALVNFSAFRSPPFSLVSVVYFSFQFVIYGIAGLLPSLATRAGLIAETGYTLLAILGGTSAFGRVIPGIIGDRLGHFNVLLSMILSTLILLGVMFIPFGTNGTVLYAFSGIWGFCSGSFLSMAPVCIGKTCEAKDYGRCYGCANFVISFALLISIPANGTMIEKMGSQGLGGLLTGVLALGGVCLFSARALLMGKWFSYKPAI